MLSRRECGQVAERLRCVLALEPLVEAHGAPQAHHLAAKPSPMARGRLLSPGVKHTPRRHTPSGKRRPRSPACYTRRREKKTRKATTVKEQQLVCTRRSRGSGVLSTVGRGIKVVSWSRRGHHSM